MKKLFYTTLMLLMCAVLKTNAQAVIPGASTTQTISQDLSLGKVTITYSRPNVKGRKIFGGLQPYGEVWRTGANAATTITLTENTIIEGNKVPAGEYGLFTIPGPDEWTIILNKTFHQWGAYTYKQADDLLRFKIKPTTMNKSVETFTMQFSDATATSNDLNLIWDKTAVRIHFESDDDAQVMANIDTLMQKAPKDNASVAIQYYYENNKDLSKALGWATAAQNGDPKDPYYMLWIARLKLKMGDKPGAIEAAIKGIQLARDNKDDEYVRLNQMVLDKAKATLNSKTHGKSKKLFN
jgi:tetratricopeptide (TPR) repeat protein